jgi:hypothetical protein
MFFRKLSLTGTSLEHDRLENLRCASRTARCTLPSPGPALIAQQVGNRL